MSKMDWDRLLCGERARKSVSAASGDQRSEFQKDYHRIISSASFRRLQDKTQVFTLDSSDFVRTRLTHSLEVSSFAKSLGQMTFNDLIAAGSVTPDIRDKCCAILECSGLLHDIGNPPFGHFGEDSIRSWFAVNLGRYRFKGRPVTDLLNEQMKSDLTHFEGNAQALRLLTKLHFLVDENGMNLTFALLNTLIKYPVSSLETDKSSPDIKLHKMGYYLAEEDIFRRITEATGAVGCRYPLTFLLEAADDIAYKTADIEDAAKKGFFGYDTLLADLKSGRYISKPFDPDDNSGDDDDLAVYRSCIESLEKKYAASKKRGAEDPGMNAVQNWVISMQSKLLFGASKAFVKHYDKIMDGTLKSDLISLSPASSLAEALGRIAFGRVFRSPSIMKSELTEGYIINFYLDKLVPAAIALEDDAPLDPVSDRLLRMLSGNYRRIYEHYADGKDENYRLYLRILLVTDFVCGMTDSYAKRSYQELIGII